MEQSCAWSPAERRNKIRADPLRAIINSKIQHVRASSLDTMRLSIHVIATKNAKPLLATNGNFLGFDRYIFDAWNQASVELGVEFLEDEQQVLVETAERCMLVDEYIKSLPIPSTPIAHQGSPYIEILHARWREQAGWWAATGKTFRLTDLPREIRDNFYLYAMGPVVVPLDKRNRKRRGAMSQYRLRPNWNLLRVSKQIKVEAQEVLCRYTPIYMGHSRSAIRLLENPRAPIMQLRYLELALSHVGFFALFGCALLDSIVLETQPAAVCLRNMTLSSLELQMPAMESLTKATWLDGGCQTTVVDWILDAAWPFVKAHPVQLTGFMKNGQKEAWEERFAAERKKIAVWRAICRRMAQSEQHLMDEYDDEVGGVTLENLTLGEDGEESAEGSVQDVDKAAYVPSSMLDAAELPPICRCRTRCAVGKPWSPDT